MRTSVIVLALCASQFPGLARGVAAQGIATGTVRGTVRTVDGASLDGARVRILNSATGLGVNAQVRHGRFLVQGVEVGGPYVVSVRQVGFLPQELEGRFLTLGEPLELRFVMQPVARGLDTVLVTGASMPGGGGAVTLISDSLVHRLPTLNRSFLDFVQLAPQVSTKIGFQRSGMSAAGANVRFNNYLINGAEERLVASSVSPANAGKSIPIDAVKEYQVLVAPYDVRYGDFAGALVNTVTQAGTNVLHGSAFAYWRNNRLARGGGLAPDSARYERWQYGLSLGGPIVRDRIHFFVASEFQRLTSPAPGPYLGQPATASPKVPVSEASVEQFGTILRGHGLSAGSGGPAEVENPLQNVFARMDAVIGRWNSRVIGFVTYAHTEDSEFSRSALNTFYLTSYEQVTAGRLRLASLQLHTDIARIGGGHNELVVSDISDDFDVLPAVRQPLVRALVPGTGGDLVSITAGAAEPAQGRFRRSRAVRARDELTLPLGARHLLLVGAQAERFRVQPGGVRGGYGTWSFSSLDSLARGVAERYDLQTDLGSASTALRGDQYAAYAGDEWRVGERVSVTLGVRADLLAVGGHAPYVAAIDSIFGRRTDEMPGRRIHLSPRVGFGWDLSGTGRDRLRGGVGVFTGRPPLAWLHPALSNYGVGIGALRCSSLPGDGRPPAFVPDYLEPPTACASGQGPTARSGDVDLLDPKLRIAQSLRGSLAYDRRLPWGLLASAELLVTRYLSDFMFVNMNLGEPLAVDRVGRVMYGTIGATGASVPRSRSFFPNVIELRNTSKNYSHQLSARLERQFVRGTAATVSYTYSRTRDVQSPSRVNSSGLAMWADARAYSGRHDDVVRGISLNDVPHRAVATLTYTAPWNRWPTGISFYYVGESGSPFTYLAGGAGARGDLNADGSNANDPIYVPRSALDAAEIRFSGRSDSAGADNAPTTQAERERAQRNAFEAFVARTSCLRRQRGRIVERNSCREPWSHTTVASLRQTVPMGDRAIEAELDLFNVLNLLNARWGQYRVAAPRLLEHVGQTGGAPESTEPIFRFDAARPQWTTLETESAFQLQLALRFRF